MKLNGNIYLITNKITGKQYVGLTSRSFSKRIKEHLREKRVKCRYISATINKYGKDNFLFEEIFSVFDKNDLLYFETYFINKLNTGVIKYYEYPALCSEDGFNTKQIYAVLSKKRKSYHNCLLMYFHDYVNQTGSVETKESIHGQRIESDLLIKLRNTTKLSLTDDNKYNIVNLSKKGYSGRSISKELGVCLSSVQRVIKNYNLSTSPQPLN